MKNSSGDLQRLITVTFLWALCYPLIAAGLSMAPPLFFAALRALIAGLGLLIPAFVLRRPLPRQPHVWLNLVGIGLGYTTLGFAGMFLGGGLVSPGIATVLSNAQPLIAASLAYFILREHLDRHTLTGLLLGFAGIVLTALSNSSITNTTGNLLGIGYVLLAAFGVAFSNVLLKRLAGQVDLLMATGLQFTLGGAALLLFALMSEQPIRIQWTASFTLTLMVLSLAGTALAFFLWFSLMGRNQLNHLNTFTFLTPFFALMMGVLFFNERLSWLELGGIALILGSVLWVNQYKEPVPGQVGDSAYTDKAV